MKALLIVLILTFPALAFAGDESRFYVSGAFGFVVSGDGEVDEFKNYTPELDTGFVGTLAIGTSINKYFKTELEYSRRSSGLSEIEHKEPGTFTSPITGKIFNDKKDIKLDGTGKAHALMVNSYLTLPRKKDSWFSPYVGIGVGMAWQEIKTTLTHIQERTVKDKNGKDEIIAERERLEGDRKFNETDFAYQVFAGNTWELFDILQSEIGYTYFHTSHMQTHGVTAKIIYAF